MFLPRLSWAAASIAATLLLSVPAHGQDRPEPETFPEITTRKGLTFAQVKVLAIEPDGLRLQHAAGVSKVAYAELPEPIKSRYPYDETRAAEYARAAELANRLALEATEKERLRVEKAERLRRAGVDPSMDIESDGPLTVEQVKARWLVADSARRPGFGDQDRTRREAEIARFRMEVQAGVHDREAEKVALRQNFEWYLREGRTDQARLAHERLAALEDEDLRREQIASLERLAKSMDRAAQGASNALLAELASLREELERLRLQRLDPP